ncbi:MAG: ABC transporter permease [Bacillota bacterium]|nr:ABC transporter permease [Bacillota bacterium]
MLTILNKEIKSYFYSASAYIFMGIFLFISGLFFAGANALSSSPAFNQVLSGNMTIVLLMLTPVLTMKTLAEETKSKTDQLLFTSPQRISSIVAGKYLAAVALFGIALVCTMLFPLMLSIFGKLPTSEIITAYLGFFLLGACYIAIGVFISSLTDNQVVAAIGTLGALLALLLMDLIQNLFPSTLLASMIFVGFLVVILCLIVYLSVRNVVITGGVFLAGVIVVLALYLKNKTMFEGFIGKFFNSFSVMSRYDTFATGIISVSSVIYYISFSFVFVFLTIRMIDKRRWS